MSICRAMTLFEAPSTRHRRTVFSRNDNCGQSHGNRRHPWLLLTLIVLDPPTSLLTLGMRDIKKELRRQDRFSQHDKLERRDERVRFFLAMEINIRAS
jgi:hypothetical protein